MAFGVAVLFGFRQIFTGNFVLEGFRQYQFANSLMFYIGLVFLVFGIVVFAYFKYRSNVNKNKIRKASEF
jgi:predicted transporter